MISTIYHDAPGCLPTLVRAPKHAGGLAPLLLMADRVQNGHLQVRTPTSQRESAVVTETSDGARLRPTSLVDRVAELRADTRGALLVEYSVLIGVVAIAGSLGLVLVGLALVHSFDFVRGLLLCPIP